mmetsp:Transcript_9531/g.28669  ORF Transcript_9531/g.28669 Transcript_9531/m.28669 type:complete len:205 (-) Transcript_9531:363-977(-)
MPGSAAPGSSPVTRRWASGRPPCSASPPPAGPHPGSCTAPWQNGSLQECGPCCTCRTKDRMQGGTRWSDPDPSRHTVAETLTPPSCVQTGCTRVAPWLVQRGLIGRPHSTPLAVAVPSIRMCPSTAPAPCRSRGSWPAPFPQWGCRHQGDGRTTDLRNRLACAPKMPSFPPRCASVRAPCHWDPCRPRTAWCSRPDQTASSPTP